MTTDGRERTRSGASVVVGLAVMALGALFFLGELGVLEGRSALRFWPLVFVLIGLQKLLQPDARRSNAAGWIWIGVGVWILLGNLHIVHVSFGQLWAVVLIVAGWRLLWGGFHPQRGVVSSTDSDSTVNGVAIMGGFGRSITSTDFKGGSVTTIMGGCKIDLTQARIASGEAVLDVFVIWGGIDLRVPDDWTVVSRALPIMGGIDDKTQPPAASTQRLVLTGMILMGGVDIKSPSSIRR
jgi:predicted membrane protein